MSLAKSTGFIQNRAQMKRSFSLFFLAAFLTAVCSVHAYVSQPAEFPGEADAIAINPLSALANSSFQPTIKTPTITEWSSGELFSGSFTSAYGGAKTPVPGFVYRWVACHGNPVNFVDPDGRDAYAVYRKLGIDWLSWTWGFGKSAGHVYLAFDDKNMGADWKRTLNSYGYKKSAQYDPAHPRDYVDWITFSFHPESVRTKDSTGNKVSVLYTAGSWVDISGEKADIDPIIRNKVELIRITSNEAEQVRLFQEAELSARFNRTSMEAVDIGSYSFLISNCGTWAKHIVSSAGLKWPNKAKLWNVGTGLGGPLDWSLRPQMNYYGVKFGYDLVHSVLDAKPRTQPSYPFGTTTGMLRHQMMY